jgi:DNA-binding PadR family transcriptional regulator
MAKPKKSLAANWARIAILGQLASAHPEALYGIELSKSTGLPRGSVYPTLGRLVDDGFVKSVEVSVVPGVTGLPVRARYSLTVKGVRYVRELAEQLRPFLRAAASLRVETCESSL